MHSTNVPAHTILTLHYERAYFTSTFFNEKDTLTFFQLIYAAPVNRLTLEVVSVSFV